MENRINGEKKVRRVSLKTTGGKPVETVPQALSEMKRLHVKREDRGLPVLVRTPKFAEYALRYLDFISSGQGMKKPGTIQKERTTLAQWTEQIGSLRLDQIKRVHVNRFMEKRLKQNIAPRTVNLDVISLRNVLKRGVEDGYLQRLPTEGLRPLKVSTEKRPLFSSADLGALCRAAFEKKNGKNGGELPLTENAQQFVDYIRLMAYCGARRNEALGLRWDDVDFANNQLFLRRQITNRGIEDLKNRDARAVDFNPKLKSHLLEMKKQSHGISQWLFPPSARTVLTVTSSPLEVRAPAVSLRLALRCSRSPAATGISSGRQTVILSSSLLATVTHWPSTSTSTPVLMMPSSFPFAPGMVWLTF